ncbi:MAG: hypothetical protein ABIK73_00845 [candidate division WOR-3 bacterium]
MRKSVFLLIIIGNLLFSQDLSDSLYYYPGLKEPYRIVPRINYLTEKVYLEMWHDSIFLGYKNIIPLQEYFIYSAYQELRPPQTSKTSKEKITYGMEGLIPDIELPRIPLVGEGTRINISGSDRITFGGRQTFTKGFTPTPGPSRLFPELKMDQQLKVKLDGTIGDKTKVLIDHDSERDILGRNQIKISYSGTEDEIVQSLEFGDTRLLIPATNYTGDLPSRRGLFGFSGRGKLGGIDLYMVASREEAQGETKEFRGQTRIVYDTIYDVEFTRRTFFSLGEAGNARITDLRVYVKDNSLQGESAIATVLWNYPESIPPYPYDREVGLFSLRVRNQDYVFHDDGNIIEFIRNAPAANHAVAVRYVVNTDTVGGIRLINNTPTLVLKLLKPSREDTMSWCWNYELKNVYRLGATNIKLEEIKIFRIAEGVDPINYKDYETEGPLSGRTFLNILGLDPDNDGKLEWPQFDGARGLLIFPRAQPFDHESLSVRNPIIYRKINPSINEDKKYLIAVSYTATTGGFNLGQFDIEEGSEKVYVNGVQLSREEYEINYTTGELRFKNPLPANADVKVTYEYRPLFSLAQKSLLGTRGEWKFSSDGKIGSSIFYRDEVTADATQKPKLGSEALRRMITEADFSYTYKPVFLSNFLKSVPYLNNKGDVVLTLSSEAAASLPNFSRQNFVYIDDFEESQINQNVLLRGLVWKWASVPVGQDTANFARTPLVWYNPTTRIRKDSIFGSSIGEEGRDLEEYLRVIYIPDDQNSWAGIMSCLSQSGWNLKDVENLEIIFRHLPYRTGRLHFTLATAIDEDAPRRTKDGKIVGYNGTHDTEDKNGNGILDEGLGEDCGLDGVAGNDQDNVLGDDGNDDYDPYYNPMGTENNRQLDDEDLDKNGFSRYNDYYEYTISLSDSSYIVNLNGNWRLLRIPLMDSVFQSSPNRFVRSGLFNWENVRIVRLWFSGFDGADTIDIYSIAFVGSKWQKARVFIADSLLAGTTPPDTTERVSIALISQKTDINYTPPFELRKDALGRYEYEASLAVKYDSIKPGHGVIVQKTNFAKEDYREYSKIRIYVYQPPNEAFPPVYFFRFGSDSFNFYEYRATTNTGNNVAGRIGWYEFELDLDSVIFYKTLKSRRDTIIGNYRIYGSPSLSDIRYQSLGIINPYPFVISGYVWFNDIRLAQSNIEPGYGITSNASLNLGDLASFGFSYTYSDPNFKRFSEGRGVKTTGFAHNTLFNLRTNLDRFLPSKLGFNVPLSYRRTDTRGLPKYSNLYSDYRIPKSLAESEKQITNDEQLSLSGVSKRRSSNKILNYTIEALNYSFTKRKTSNYNYSGLDSTSSVSHNLDYSVSPDLTVSVGDKEISVLPDRINFGVDFGKSRTIRYTARYYDSSGVRIRKDSLLRTDSTANTNFDLELSASPIEDLNISYSLSSNRDLTVSKDRWEKFVIVPAGQETDNSESFSISYELELGDILKPEIRYEEGYDENRPKRQGEYSLRNFTSNRSLDLNTDFSLPDLLTTIFERQAGGRSVNALANMLDNINLSYSQDYEEQYQSVSSRPSFLYRLGFTDKFSYDTLSAQRPIRNLNRNRDFQASTGVRLRDLSLSIRYGRGNERQYYRYDINETRSLTWPDLTFTISRLERFLKRLATSSDINLSYKYQTRLSGLLFEDTMRLEGRREQKNLDFTPLFNWRTTWKNRLSTNLSTNYSRGQEIIRLTQGSNIIENYQKGANFSLGYNFSAPEGLPLPFLRRIRLSSNVNLNLNFRYTENQALTQYYMGNKVTTRNDRSLGTDFSASYQISNAVQAGITSGYTEYNDRQRGRSTQTVDLNIWVQFNF